MCNTWWKNGKKIPFSDKGFQSILKFYLFSCPVEFPAKRVKRKDGSIRLIPARPVSQQAITFERRRITGSRLTTLYRAMEKEVNIFFDQDIVGQYNSIKNKNCEFVIAIENTEIGRARTVFYAIRNALAHGSFSISTIKGCKGDRLYCFHAQKDEKEKARICLKESTLLSWIKKIEEKTL